jgi:hypothetical protein
MASQQNCLNIVAPRADLAEAVHVKIIAHASCTHLMSVNPAEFGYSGYQTIGPSFKDTKGPVMKVSDVVRSDTQGD